MEKTGRLTLCTTDMETVYDLGTKIIDVGAETTHTSVCNIDARTVEKRGKGKGENRRITNTLIKITFLSCVLI